MPGMGMTEATVYADQAGEEYNIGPADFTLPGLKRRGLDLKKCSPSLKRQCPAVPAETPE